MNGESFRFSSFDIGDIVEEANVIRLDKNRGLLLQLNEQISGYAHVCYFTFFHATTFLYLLVYD